MTAETFFAGKTFMAPAFRIELDGSEIGREITADVLDMSFTDDLENLDSFEFTLHDWDPVGHHPKYSSPWDENGTPLRQPDNGPEVPNFEPGARVSLYMGYLEDGDLPKIMDGEVVSISPTFPASGSPVCKVRALNAFLRGMQKVRVEGNYDGTAKEIVDAMCQENSVPVVWANLDAEGASEEMVEVEGTLYDEVASRAQEYGLTISTIVENGETKLYLSQPSESGDEPVAEFLWGRTLISFTPALSAAGQVSEVIARGGDAAQDGQDGMIEARKTWTDIGLSEDQAADITTAVDGVVDVVKPDNIASQEDADNAALARLRELAATLITGSGSAVGLPSLRAGALVTMAGMGRRFDGKYRLTQTTHAIGGSGYTTSFQCRKEVLD